MSTTYFAAFPAASECPAAGNIVAVHNNGYSVQLYFQNVVFPVATATAGGHTATQSFATWDNRVARQPRDRGSPPPAS